MFVSYSQSRLGMVASIVLSMSTAPDLRAVQATRPNFVFFLVDDLGWADVGCNGSPFHDTPHIDGLAASGVRFTNGYAAASVCSPTRASIMTGRHPVRVGITDWIPGRPSTGRFGHVKDRDNLALEEVTIAEVLRDHGYATFFAGKWHLGGEGFYPEDQGFDINIGGHEAGSPPGGYYSPWKNPKLKANFDGEYLTERLTEETNEFLASQAETDQPFFAQLSYYNVHTPIQPYQKRIDQYVRKADALAGETPILTMRDGASRGRQDHPGLASMAAAVDDSVGAVLRQLEELGMTDNTVILFFSDNGGLCTLPSESASEKRNQKPRIGPGCNLPLRSGKGWLYEGGIRVATLVRAPGVAFPGGVCDSPIMSTDFFPTILELAGEESMPAIHNDGVSLVDLLRSPELVKERTLCWHYPHYHGSGWTPGGAIRQGDWKLIEFWEYDDVELYNLGNDVEELRDLSQSHPEIKEELSAALQAWRDAMGAMMPKPIE